MAVNAVLPTFGVVPPQCVPPGLLPRDFIADSEADLPTSDFGVGSRAVCIAEKSSFICVDEEQWKKNTLDSIFQLHLTGQSAAIPFTKVYMVPSYAAGMYRLSYSAKVSTPDGVSSSLGGADGLQVGYTSNDDSVDVLTAPSIVSTLNTNQAQISGVIVVNAKADNWILIQFGYTSASGTMIYDFNAVIETL